MRRTEPDAATAARLCDPIPKGTDPAVEASVHDIIGKVADRWTMLILEVSEERGTLRFTEFGRSLGAAFCGVWIWAETHREAVERSRAAFAGRRAAGVCMRA